MCHGNITHTQKLRKNTIKIRQNEESEQWIFQFFLSFFFFDQQIVTTLSRYLLPRAIYFNTQKQHT